MNVLDPSSSGWRQGDFIERGRAMNWKEAVGESPVGMAAYVREQGEVIVVRCNESDDDVPKRLFGKSHVLAIADELDGEAWTVLGVPVDPLARVKSGSAIQLVCEMGQRLDQIGGDLDGAGGLHVSAGRVFALEMLVATACVYYRNQLIAGQTDKARLALAALYSTYWLTELQRYVVGDPAPFAPGTRPISDGQAQ
jgi:hypothetical protein